jgi:micrococcal nuclease
MNRPTKRVSICHLGGGLLLVVGLCAPSAKACDLPEGETAAVAAIEDGETLQLTDGRKVRLLGVKAPSPPLGWKGEDPWPLVAESKAALRRLASGTIVELLALEAEARRERHGLWRSWAYRVQDAGDTKRLGRLTHTYQLVEGTVHAVGEGRKLIYVNFAEDWHTDFTVTIARKDLASFEAAGLDLDRLAGKRVRVRGWVEWWNGPMIAATHPAQIEMLAPAPAL